MTAKHMPMDKDRLLEELQELQIKLAMASCAEREGKRLLKENEDLKKDPFYQPTDEAESRFRKTINRHYYMQKAKNMLHASYG